MIPYKRRICKVSGIWILILLTLGIIILHTQNQNNIFFNSYNNGNNDNQWTENSRMSEFLKRIFNPEVASLKSNISQSYVIKSKEIQKIVESPTTTEFSIPDLPEDVLYKLFKNLDETTPYEIPKVDTRPNPDDSQMLREISDTLESLPDFYQENHTKPLGHNETCALFPDLFELEINNFHWQSLYTSNGNLHLLNAYLDVRNLTVPSIRILGVMNRIEPSVSLYCQFWFEESKSPVITIVNEKQYMWHKEWGNYKQGLYEPYLFSCVLPEKEIPKSVSIVEKQCDKSTNNLNVIYNPADEKKDFAVCVKGLDFLHADLSVRIAEWIELINILGADKIFIYVLQLHANITKLLDYYQVKGKVEVIPINLPGGQSNIPSFQHLHFKNDLNNQCQNGLMHYNDCFYKHMYEYKYIALLDTDEVLMPEYEASWKDLMEKIVVPKSKILFKSEIPGSFNFRNVYFFDDDKNFRYTNGIPKYHHMLQHVYRSKHFTPPGYFVKSFHNTENVLTLHNHFPLSCLGYRCLSYYVETSDAHMHHYRRSCQFSEGCDVYKTEIVVDSTIWRYKEELVKRLKKTLTDLGYF